jgi:hypothetical protein
LFCGSKSWGRFSLLVAGYIACKSNMLLRLLWKTFKFMIDYLFLVLAFSNLVGTVWPY